MKNNFTLYRISPWSLFKISFLVGWIATFLPVAFLITLVLRLAVILANWLGGLVYQVRLPIPGNFGFDINVIELLHLQNFYERLDRWALVGGLQALVIILVLTSLIALFWGLVATIAGLVFNLFSRAIGGIGITLAENPNPASPEASVKPIEQENSM
jgi:hypothetical protein